MFHTGRDDFRLMCIVTFSLCLDLSEVYNRITLTSPPKFHLVSSTQRTFSRVCLVSPPWFAETVKITVMVFFKQCLSSCQSSTNAGFVELSADSPT